VLRACHSEPFVDRVAEVSTEKKAEATHAQKFLFDKPCVEAGISKARKGPGESQLGEGGEGCVKVLPSGNAQNPGVQKLGEGKGETGAIEGFGSCCSPLLDQHFLDGIVLILAKPTLDGSKSHKGRTNPPAASVPKLANAADDAAAAPTTNCTTGV